MTGIVIDLRHFLKSAVARIFGRYAVGSVISAVVSEVTLLTCYGLKLLSPQGASIAAWAVGSVVNYSLSRWWAWGRRGRPKPLRELLPFWLTSVVGLLFSSWATGVADGMAQRMFTTDGPRVVFVGAVFLGTYGLLFFAKFAFFHYFVFADTGSEPAEGAGTGEDEEEAARRRSRSQVPTTTRE
ncbi:Putative flippase GtrA (transmembrane translocase of bactoprenol-linked glucose) [Nonomuraea jiangxiensis]|uniref:Putative flippase GtrA (Transmembrane translocase of bactoprenol-linked glucose) n=1 Tax=Nonomuraea jiangxiensis TaxID=633440 RepID=A0A1G8Y1M4_9ACTN|nr:Putative flippase GtrA (transmembrane translocase of bactoprenol-linked glucose) [Nonomuraea jiangxiensis]